MYYTKEHQWISVDGQKALLGITRFAADELQDVTYVSLPEVEKEILRGQLLCTVEAVKASSEIVSPLTVRVMGINTLLSDSPELVSDDPLEKGWLVELEILKPEELKDLLSVEQL